MTAELVHHWCPWQIDRTSPYSSNRYFFETCCGVRRHVHSQEPPGGELTCPKCQTVVAAVTEARLRCPEIYHVEGVLPRWGIVDINEMSRIMYCLPYRCRACQGRLSVCDLHGIHSYQLPMKPRQVRRGRKSGGPDWGYFASRKKLERLLGKELP